METGRSTAVSRLVQWGQSPAARALAALVLVLLLGAIFNSNGTFFKEVTHITALRAMSVFGILACGMTLVIMTGGIDLSVGSVLALCAVCSAKMAADMQLSPWIVVPTTLLIGAACGGVSGGLASKLKIQPFIVTLAMMVFARGLAKHVSGGMKIPLSQYDDAGNYSRIEWFATLNSRALGDRISVVTIVFLACFLVAYIALSRFKWGRELYAIGGNEEAARLSGVPVVWSKTLAYVASGVFAAVAGLCHAAQETQGDPEAGVAYELSAIAMVVIGGTSLMGGRGGMGLTLLGILTIGYLEKILSINFVPEAWRLMLTGVIIVIAVLAQRRGRS